MANGERALDPHRPSLPAPPAAGNEADDHPTPIPVSPRARTLIGVALLLVLAWLVWAAPIVPRLLVTGAAAALVLSFPVRLLSRLLPRALAIGLVMFGTVLLLGLVALIPFAIVQLSDLIAAAPQYVDEAEGWLLRTLEGLAARGWLTDDPQQVIDEVRQGLIDRVQGGLDQILGAVLGGLSGVVGAVLQVFGVLFVAVYLLADVGRFKQVVLEGAPPRYRDDVAALWDQMAHSLSRYLGGLLVSITAQGALAALALWLLDVPYPLLFGLLTAVTAVLPYVGAFLGAIPAVVVAFFVSPTTAVLTALAYLVINQIDANLLTPKIQGDAVRVHPLLIFLGVLVGNQVGGLLGAALAVPVLAVLRVLADFFGDRIYVSRHGGSERVGVGPLPAVGVAPGRPGGADDGTG